MTAVSLLQLQQLHLGPAQVPVFLSAFMAGAACAGVAHQPLTQHAGPKSFLTAAAVGFAGSGVLYATAHSFPALIAARLVSGAAAGLALIAAPQYIAEAPQHCSVRTEIPSQRSRTRRPGAPRPRRRRP